MADNVKPLSRLDFILAKAGLYGWFHQQARSLSRRSVVRFVSLGRGRRTALSCVLLTDNKMPLAGGVEIERQYYSVTGYPIENRPSPIEEKTLVALPLELEQAQTVWLDPPEKAAFALVHFRRVTGRPDYYFRLEPRVRRAPQSLKNYRPRQSGPPQQSRDLLYLWCRLKETLKNGEVDLSESILQRIRYLHDSEEARSVQTVLFKDGLVKANKAFHDVSKRWFAL